MIDEQQIEKWFGEHETTEAQKDAYRKVLASAKAFVVAVNENMPDGEDKGQVINSVRQSILTVELAIRYRFQGIVTLAKDVN